MAEIKITNIVKFYCVLLLYEGPKHGYEIIKEVELKLGKRTSPGEIYPFLKKLRRQKYVGVKQAGVREKKIYSLTPRGRAFAKAMLSRFGSLIELAIEPRLTVCIHCGCKVYEGGHKEKIKGKNLMFCCHHCAKSYKAGKVH